MDVYTTVQIPFTTAVFGGEARIQTIHGDVICKIKPGTQSGSKIRLRGKGIVSMKNSKVFGDQYAQYVADGIVSVENVLQPDIISVGGGISREGEYLLQPVCEYAAANGFNKFMPKTKIVTAQSFNDAGIIGAAMIAK